MIRYTTNTNKSKEFIEVSKVNLYEVIDQLMREEGLELLDDHKWIPHKSRHARNMYAHTGKGKDGEERIIYLNLWQTARKEKEQEGKGKTSMDKTLLLYCKAANETPKFSGKVIEVKPRPYDRISRRVR